MNDDDFLIVRAPVGPIHVAPLPPSNGIFDAKWKITQFIHEQNITEHNNQHSRFINKRIDSAPPQRRAI